MKIEALDFVMLHVSLRFEGLLSFHLREIENAACIKASLLLFLSQGTVVSPVLPLIASLVKALLCI